MKRFRRLPSIEQLEEKRLKAADLANCSAAHGDEIVEVANSSSSSLASGPQLANTTQQASATSVNLTSEESDEEEDEEDESNESDESDDDDDSDEDESEEVEDEESDEEGDEEEEEDEEEESDDEEEESDESDDSEEESESEENESEEDESEESESDEESDDEDSDESDEDESEENESDDSEEEDESDEHSEEDDSDDDQDENETELSADLTATTGNSGTGNAEFESETEGSTTNREFELKVTGATTNGSLITGNQEVRVGGVLIGNISLTDGNGELKFNTDPDDDESEFPSNFPTTVDATTVVAVGPQNTPILTGTFGTSSNLQSLAALQSIAPSLVEAAQAAANTDPLVVEAPSGATRAAVQNEAAVQAADQNLLDIGFATATVAPDANLAVRYDSETSEHNVQDVDAALEVLTDGELRWTA